MTDANVNHDGEVGATSLSLLERVRNQDQIAWVRLIDLYDPLLTRWCLRAGLQPADVAGVKQDVFAAVMRAIGDFQYDRPGATFRGWLFTITRNKICDRSRSAEVAGLGGSATHLHLVPTPEDDSGQEPLDPDDERALYLQAIEMIRSEFESKTWNAFWMVTVDGRNVADVAKELGMSPNAVYLARSRILAKLRKEFETLISPNPNPSTSPSAQTEGG